MTQDTFQSGLAVIEAAFREGLERHTPDATIERRAEGADGSVEFAITANGQTQAQVFLRQEIEDSGIAIDAPAALKVRMLVSHFAR